MSESQSINLLIELPANASKDEVVQAIRDAADRAAGQIEYDILRFPLEVDEQIELGSVVESVESVMLYRSE